MLLASCEIFRHKKLLFLEYNKLKLQQAVVNKQKAMSVLVVIEFLMCNKKHTAIHHLE